MAKQSKKRIRGVTALLTVATLSLCACDSFIIIHDTPLSDGVQTIVPPDETAGADSAPVPERPDAETETAAETQVSVTPLETAKDALAALRDIDLEGKNFIIDAVGTTAPFGDAFDGDEAGSQVIPDTRAQRTRLVEEKYNVRIMSFTYEREELFTEVKEKTLSGMFVSDFCALPAADIGRYQANGLLFNLRSLPFTDFTADCFDKNAMEQFSAGYGIYAAIGDYTFSPENVHAVFYNKKLSDTLGISSHYQTVRDGAWTWDILKTNTVTADTYTDINGEEPYNGGNFASFDDRVAEAIVLASSGEHIVSTGLDREPSMTADTAVPDALLSFIRDLFLNGKGEIGGENPFLDDGTSLYRIADLSHVKKWSDSEVVWGVLPLPKADTAQKNYFSYAGDSPVFCVPSIVVAPEATGTVLQALFVASCAGYPELYLDEALSYYVRDGESVEMLSLILDNVYYDFAYSFASGYKQLSNASLYGLHYAATSGITFSSMYNTYKSEAAKEIAAAFGIR